jgi:hypothetical protein
MVVLKGGLMFTETSRIQNGRIGWQKGVSHADL